MNPETAAAVALALVTRKLERSVLWFGTQLSMSHRTIQDAICHLGLVDPERSEATKRKIKRGRRLAMRST